MALSLTVPSRRGRPHLGLWMCLVLGAVAGGNACGSSSGDAGSPAIDTGEPDRPSNGRVRVEEAGIVATVAGDSLQIDVPVTAIEAAAKGELGVSTISVDGKSTLATAALQYDLDGSETRTARVSLPVPSGVSLQADWARFSLRIDDGSTTGLRTTTSLLRIVRPYEVRLEGPASVSKDKVVTYRVRAQQPLSQAPIEGLEVELEVASEGQEPRTLKGVTNATGDAVFQVTATTTAPLQVRAKASADRTSALVEHPVTVTEAGRKVLVTTDKPIYQPGQTIHLRAVALAPPSNTPIAGEAVLFEIEDGKGNKIYKKELTSDAYGIAHSRFVIGSIVNEGAFKVRVTASAQVTEKTVNVSRYALPKFGVDVDLARAWYRAGETVSGTIDARYFFGKAVSGADVVIEGYTVDIGESVFGRIQGRTDAAGLMTFDLPLPASLVGLPLEQGNALASFRVTITDTAGQVVTKESAVTVAPDGVRVSVVPESTTLVPGVENRLQVFVSDPLGGPLAGAAVRITAGTEVLEGTTNPFGHLELRFTPSAAASDFSLTVDVTPEGESPVQEVLSFGAQSGAEHVLVRTDKSVYDVGETVTVEVVASDDTRAYVDWLNEGQAVDMRTVELTDGVATFTMPLDATLLGSNRIEAYIVDSAGNFVRAGRTLFARSDAALAVSMTASKATYAPAESATLTFSVKDAAGQPRVAALGVQIVDEAVFSLVEARPGLLETYFQLEDDYAEPRYQIAAPIASFQDLLFDKTRSANADEARAAQAKTEASLAAMGATSLTGIQEGSWVKVVTEVKARLEPYWEDARKSTVAALQPVVEAHVAALVAEGCKVTDYWCEAVQSDLGTALSKRVTGSFSGADFWGSPYGVSEGGYGSLLRLSSSGPDEIAGNGDDTSFTIQFSDLDLDALYRSGGADAGVDFGGGFPGPPANEGPWAGAGGASASGGASSGPPTPGEAAGPRVRREFPETLYVNPALITGPDGTASIQVPLADSITEWRVSTLAHSQTGDLGGATSGITVFQDFFADIDFPATLTRGDQVEFPVAVYNYLGTAQTVHLELEAAPWYTALGATTQDVALAPGEVKGVRFPVRVDRVGTGTLTVRALGTTLSDAVARSVTVVPDGKAFPTTASGALAAGSITHSAVFPAGAIAGSEKLYVNVYPAFLSQVVAGMDSMLQVPSGCFEQTTSTAWPNVLVTRYMEETQQITPELQAKAESLMSAGYQRLLTFEHPGGGFSWFGTQDPAPYLSVTAFGLMEFSDMAKVHPVDEAMLARTTAWLAGKQEANGSWAGDQTEFFSFHTSTVRNTAFVVWALASAGYAGSELQSGLGYVLANMDAEPADSYTLGIVANALALAAPSDPATTRILSELDAAKQTDGDKIFWDAGDTQTSFYGSGDDSTITATALVTHALLTNGGHAATVNGAIQYLTSKKDSLGNFGSTQATIWTLRTLLLAATKGTEGAVGTLAVSVDGAPFSTVSLTADQSDVMTTVDLSTLATVGSHDVALAFTGTGKVSYNLVASHHLPWQAVPAEPPGPLSIAVAYDKTTLRLDETVTATVTVGNNTGAVQNMVLVTLGIPPGFRVRTEDLDAYKAAGQLSHYELTGKQLTLYLSALPAGAPSVLSYRLVATLPVVADDGGAQVSLYYEPEKKAALAGKQLTVTE